MNELDSLQITKLDYIIEEVNEISKNTDAWGGNLSYFLTTLTVMASIATIFGLSGFLYQYIKDSKKRTISLKRQELIVLDLIRHVFVNAAIMEVIRIKMDEKWGELHPLEGTFSKFCVLDTDLRLDRIEIKDSLYTKLHSLSLFLRNYNILSMLAEKHFNDPLFSPKEKEKELDELWERTKKISNDFMDLCNETNLRITPESVHEYIADHYDKKEKERIKENKPLPKIDIPKRDGKRDYFDIEFDLGDKFDYCIRDWYGNLRMIPFNQNAKQENIIGKRNDNQKGSETTIKRKAKTTIKRKARQKSK